MLLCWWSFNGLPSHWNPTPFPMACSLFLMGHSQKPFQSSSSPCQAFTVPLVWYTAFRYFHWERKWSIARCYRGSLGMMLMRGLQPCSPVGARWMQLWPATKLEQKPGYHCLWTHEKCIFLMWRQMCSLSMLIALINHKTNKRTKERSPQPHVPRRPLGEKQVPWLLMKNTVIPLTRYFQ